MDLLPPALPGTALRVLATTDLAAELIPRRVSWGEGGTCAGVVALLEWERERQPTVWLDAGDLTVGPAAALLGERPWGDIGQLPIDAAAAGNHEFDDPDALSRRYEYYDPIRTLPESGKAYWRRFGVPDTVPVS